MKANGNCLFRRIFHPSLNPPPFSLSSFPSPNKQNHPSRPFSSEAMVLCSSHRPVASLPAFPPYTCDRCAAHCRTGSPPHTAAAASLSQQQYLDSMLWVQSTSTSTASAFEGLADSSVRSAPSSVVCCACVRGQEVRLIVCQVAVRHEFFCFGAKMLSSTLDFGAHQQTRC